MDVLLTTTDVAAFARALVEPPARWAPCPTRRKGAPGCRCKCIDRNVYHRPKHVFDGDGVCIFCDEERRR